MSRVVGQRRKRAAAPEPGTRVWANARREAEAPSEALTCAICMDVFDAVRVCVCKRQRGAAVTHLRRASARRVPPRQRDGISAGARAE